MSKRSREAVKLARDLSAYWHLDPGGVEVVWTDGWFAGRYRLGYEIRWSDGPTLERMRDTAEHWVRLGPGLAELVGGDGVRYERSLSLLAWAVKLLAHIHNGGRLPDLDQDRAREAWLAELERTDFPERARTKAEQALAARLVDHALHEYGAWVRASDRARTEGRRPSRWVSPEVLLARAVAAHGRRVRATIDWDDRAGLVVDLGRYRHVCGELGRE
jgi:hypothetical protein